MVKQFIKICLVLIVAYVGLIQIQIWIASQKASTFERYSDREREPKRQKVYSFAFSKYDTSGQKELEIEGDTADIRPKIIIFTNVLAKAYAEDSPITITADSGIFNKATSNIHLEKNVIATTVTGTRLLTEELNIDPKEKMVHTPVFAKVKRENIYVEGIGVSADSGLKQVNFKRNVTVVIQNPDLESGAPTIITSDGPLEIDYERNIANFSDNVIARDERGRLFADFMDVYYDGDTKKIYKIICTGNVIITSKDGHTTYSDNAVYLADEGKVILGGDVETIGSKERPEKRSNSNVFDLVWDTSKS